MNAIHPMQTGSSFKPNKKTGKKKINPMKDSKVVDYLDPKFLTRFTNDQGKILPRRITGLTAYQQRQIATAVKYARHLALVPFVAQDLA
ncbi:MAG: 30S ribosomal protein S18 [Candidatus Kapabacteria bacterium]|jgi:small subunit ribosomal protein S18|nr:30S ribosomal protein S18 [Candidatus Kapabacteria bacterium]